MPPSLMGLLMSPHTTAAYQGSFHMNERAFGREVAEAPAQVEIIITADGVGDRIRNSACTLIVILDEIHSKNNLQSTVSQTSEMQEQQLGSDHHLKRWSAVSLSKCCQKLFRFQQNKQVKIDGKLSGAGVYLHTLKFDRSICGFV